MRLKRLLLRYYPPAIFLVFRSSRAGIGEIVRTVDLSHLMWNSSPMVIAQSIMFDERLPDSHKDQVTRLVRRLIRQLCKRRHSPYTLSFPFSPHPLPCTNVAMDRNGRVLATTSFDKTCRVWDLNSSSKVHSLTGHRNVVCCVAISEPVPSMKDAICSSGRHLLAEHDGPAAAPETLVSTGSFDRTACLWKAKSGELLHTLSGHSGEVVAVAFSKDGALVVTASTDKTARVWDCATGAEVQTLGGHGAEVSCVGFLPDGKQAYTGCCDSQVRLFSVETGDCVRTLEGHTGAVAGVDVTHNGAKICSGADDGVVYVWEVKEGRQLVVHNAEAGEVTSVRFNAGGRMVVATYEKGIAVILDCSSAQAGVLHRLEGHAGSVSCAAFNYQSTRVVTGGDKGEARLWNLETGKCTQVLRGHTNDVFFAAFNYNGSVLTTASTDTVVNVWRCDKPRNHRRSQSDASGSLGGTQDTTVGSFRLINGSEQSIATDGGDGDRPGTPPRGGAGTGAGTGAGAGAGAGAGVPRPQSRFGARPPTSNGIYRMGSSGYGGGFASFDGSTAETPQSPSIRYFR